MELRAIVNRVTQYVNNNTFVTIEYSTGFTLGNAADGFKQVPTYGTTSGWADLQAISNDELNHESLLNLQGTFKVLYISGELYAVVHPYEIGGDKVTIGSDIWLVVQVLERWDTWCKVIICLQNPSP